MSKTNEEKEYGMADFIGENLCYTLPLMFLLFFFTWFIIYLFIYAPNEIKEKYRSPEYGQPCAEDTVTFL